MQKRWITLPVLLILTGLFSFRLIFDVPDQARLKVFQNGQWHSQEGCYISESSQRYLDTDGRFTLLVWNIYKQQRDNWQAELTHYTRRAQLVLLQEASLTDPLRTWMTGAELQGQAVEAFTAFDRSAGVMNLSSIVPQSIYAHAATEPLIRLPKSATYSLYPLSDGTSLMVINIHSINFTPGTEAYRRQLQQLSDYAKNHQGPLLFAGDFNSWSEARMAVLEQIMTELKMKPAHFSPDNRTRFITGLPLDGIYYRDLVLETAQAAQSDASDHNPLLVSFRLNSSFK